MCSKSLPDLGEQARAIACRQHDASLASETCANIEWEARIHRQRSRARIPWDRRDLGEAHPVGCDGSDTSPRSSTGVDTYRDDVRWSGHLPRRTIERSGFLGWHVTRTYRRLSREER
jgi:hypothetical protein